MDFWSLLLYVQALVFVLASRLPGTQDTSIAKWMDLSWTLGWWPLRSDSLGVTAARKYCGTAPSNTWTHSFASNATLEQRPPGIVWIGATQSYSEEGRPEQVWCAATLTIGVPLLACIVLVVLLYILLSFCERLWFSEAALARLERSIRPHTPTGNHSHAVVVLRLQRARYNHRMLHWRRMACAGLLCVVLLWPGPALWLLAWDFVVHRASPVGGDSAAPAFLAALWLFLVACIVAVGSAEHLSRWVRRALSPSETLPGIDSSGTTVATGTPPFRSEMHHFHVDASTGAATPQPGKDEPDSVVSAAPCNCALRHRCVALLSEYALPIAGFVDEPLYEGLLQARDHGTDSDNGIPVHLFPRSWPVWWATSVRLLQLLTVGAGTSGVAQALSLAVLEGAHVVVMTNATHWHATRPWRRRVGIATSSLLTLTFFASVLWDPAVDAAQPSRVAVSDAVVVVHGTVLWVLTAVSLGTVVKVLAQMLAQMLAGEHSSQDASNSVAPPTKRYSARRPAPHHASPTRSSPHGGWSPEQVDSPFPTDMGPQVGLDEEPDIGTSPRMTAPRAPAPLHRSPSRSRSPRQQSPHQQAVISSGSHGRPSPQPGGSGGDERGGSFDRSVEPPHRAAARPYILRSASWRRANATQRGRFASTTLANHNVTRRPPTHTAPPARRLHAEGLTRRREPRQRQWSGPQERQSAAAMASAGSSPGRTVFYDNPAMPYMSPATAHPSLPPSPFTKHAARAEAEQSHPVAEREDAGINHSYSPSPPASVDRASSAWDGVHQNLEELEARFRTFSPSRIVSTAPSEIDDEDYPEPASDIPRRHYPPSSLGPSPAASVGRSPPQPRPPSRRLPTNRSRTGTTNTSRMDGGDRLGPVPQFVPASISSSRGWPGPPPSGGSDEEGEGSDEGDIGWGGGNERHWTQ